MHTFEDTGASEKKFLGTFLTGLIMSAGLTFLFHSVISVAYKYLPGSVILLAGLTILCFLIFWVNIKYDQYLDVNDVFFKTISLNDFNGCDHKFRLLFARFIRPLNPYIGVLGTISGLFLVVCAVPALIIYSTAQPNHAAIWLGTTVYIVSAGSGLLFYFSNKDKVHSAVDKIIFFSGILLAPAGVIKIVL